MVSNLPTQTNQHISPTSLTGLTRQEVEAQQQKYGKNILPAEKMRSAVSIFFSQF